MFAMVVGLAISAGALDPTTPLSQYVRTSWTSAEGLPQDSAYSILQTRDGFIWFGTTEGLVRFDGTRFTIFDKARISALKYNAVIALLEDRRDGSLWIGSYGGGLIHYSAGEFHCYTIKDGLASNFVLALAQDPAGDLWIGTDRGLATFHDNRIRAYKQQKLDGEKIASLALGSNGTLWVAAGSRILKLDVGTGTVSQIDPGINDPTYLYFDREQRLWIGTRAHGLYSSTGGKLIHYRDIKVGAGPIFSILQDHEHQIWIASIAKGVCRLSANKPECLTGKDALTGSGVVSLYEDREGSVWIGTSSAGITRLKDKRFRTYDRKLDGMTNDMVFALYQDRDMAVWAGTADGLVHLKGDRITTYKIGKTPDSNIVTAIAEGSSGTLWLGTAAGLKEFKNGRVISTYTTHDGLAAQGVYALHREHSGNLWIGNGGHAGGLTRFAGGKFKTFTADEAGLNTNRVSTIVEDHLGNLWFGTARGLTVFKDGKFKNYVAESEPTGDMVSTTSIYEDSSNDLWVGTAGAGVRRFRNGQFTSFSSKNGLFADTIWGILGDAAGSLWMTSNRGLFRVNKQDLNDFADGKVKTIPYVSYGTKDGLPVAEFNGGYQSVAWRTADGRMLFASIRGIVELDLHHFPNNSLPPPVVLEAAFLNREPLQDGSRKPVGSGRLEFEFAGLSFLAPENVTYKYQLIGFDKDWIAGGPRASASYTNVPPGHYVFRVIASNNDGVWNTEGAAVAFTLKPRFVQTPWFYILCAAGLILVGVGVQTLRNRRTRANERRLTELVEVRTGELRLATARAETAVRAKSEFLANMSHEIRTPLNGLLGMVELTSQTELSPQQQELLGIATHSGTVLLNVLNDILDYSKIEAGKMQLQSEDFRSANVIASIRHIAARRAEKKGLSFSYHVDSDIPALMTGDSGRLTQVLLNLVDNAVKFTAQGEITLTIDVDTQVEDLVRLKICVADTGIGVPKEHQENIFKSFEQGDNSTTRKFGGTGLGLSIVSHLVGLMDGQIWVESEPGRGSSFYITPVFKLVKNSAPSELSPSGSLGDTPGAALLPPLNILVAEDNVINQMLAVRLLEGMGHQVTVVGNGQEAIDKVSAMTFDVVLMDVQMPEVDGIAATQTIRAMGGGSSLERLPIIAMTAHAMDSDRVRCLAAGMDGYISKPISSAQLMKTIGDIWYSVAQPRNADDPMHSVSNVVSS
jgi:signal transduction histidine kinase/ligand-binding sensor domain-containing protein/CheY-like chemotaxis protein